MFRHLNPFIGVGQKQKKSYHISDCIIRCVNSFERQAQEAFRTSVPSELIFAQKYHEINLWDSNCGHLTWIHFILSCNGLLYFTRQTAPPALACNYRNKYRQDKSRQTRQSTKDSYNHLVNWYNCLYYNSAIYHTSTTCVYTQSEILISSMPLCIGSVTSNIHQNMCQLNYKANVNINCWHIYFHHFHLCLPPFLPCFNGRSAFCKGVAHSIQ